MKKLLSIAIVTTLLTTAISANTITLNATVPLSTNVTLGSNTATLGATTGFSAFNAANKTLGLNTNAQVLMDENVNLITNATASAVTMTLGINAMTNGGTGSITPTCAYDKALSGTYVDITTTAFKLTNKASADVSTIVGKLKCEAVITTTQTSGSYTGTIDVTIASN